LLAICVVSGLVHHALQIGLELVSRIVKLRLSLVYNGDGVVLHMLAVVLPVRRVTPIIHARACLLCMLEILAPQVHPLVIISHHAVRPFVLISQIVGVVTTFGRPVRSRHGNTDPRLQLINSLFELLVATGARVLQHAANLVLVQLCWVELHELVDTISCFLLLRRWLRFVTAKFTP
jgi:hypothetical protein